jgi:hypothetical protein
VPIYQWDYHIYQVPSKTALQDDNDDHGEVVTLSYSRLNNNLLDDRLTTPKIEGVIYILHGNAQVVV